MVTLAEPSLLATASVMDDRRGLTSGHRSPPDCNIVIGELVSAVHAVRDGSKPANRLFEAHVLRALAICVAGTEEGLFLHEGNRGGLALSQLERATRMMEAHLGGHVCIRAVARECGLTASHFARAFRVSTGVAPSEWLMERRIATAKTLLSTTPKKLSEVALDCGFTDQSHFTRVFSRRVGVSPGRWRAAAGALSSDGPTGGPDLRAPAGMMH